MRGTPLPLGTAGVDALNTAIADHHPGQGLSAMQRAWLAGCRTTLLVTQAVGWARFERTSLGLYALAALAWLFRHAKIPRERLVVARIRLWRRQDGRTPGGLGVDDTATPRANSATPLASRHQRWDKDRGGHRRGHRRLLLLGVPAPRTLPVGGRSLGQPPS